MKKLLLSTLLMLGSIQAFATCPTVAQCNAISDSYGKYQCLQQANQCPQCHTEVVKGTCTEQPSHYCDNVPAGYSLSMCLLNAPKTVQVCSADTTKTVCP